MATEKKVFEIIKEAGFEPIEDKGIVVKYAPENLSAKIANFFSMEFYVLQLCKDELVPVSYTHLDVYKRQGAGCYFRRRAAGGPCRNPDGVAGKGAENR